MVPPELSPGRRILLFPTEKLPCVQVLPSVGVKLGGRMMLRLSLPAGLLSKGYNLQNTLEIGYPASNSALNLVGSNPSCFDIYHRTVRPPFTPTLSRRSGLSECSYGQYWHEVASACGFSNISFVRILTCRQPMYIGEAQYRHLCTYSVAW